MKKIVATLGLALVACGSTATEEESSQAQISAPAPQTGSLTVASCEAAGGSVVTDPGNGSVHEKGFLCRGTDKPPIGSMEFGIEAAVCCLSGRALEASECEGVGGRVQPDPGNGSVHEEGYVCPQTGAPPIATVRLFIEGGVCCL